MSDEADKSRRRWGWPQWGTAAFLCYLWGWLILWALAKLGLFPADNNDVFRAVVSIVYFPILLLRALINWFR
jgi:hypothetical protein